MTGIRGDEFDELIDQARAAVDAVRARGAGDDAAAAEPVTAQAADGLVGVVMTPAGKLAQITVEPRLLREGIESICEHITLAVNAAIDELRARSRPAAAVDPEALAATLRDLQTDSVRRMAAFGSAVDDVVARLIQAGQRR